MKGNATMMTSILIAALFASGAAFAVASIVATLRAYWPAVLALRADSAWMAEEQELRVTSTDLRGVRTGRVLHADFSGRSRVPAAGLRAAA
jgi:hypothetical protein